MAEQQWEYCVLWLHASDHMTTGGVIRDQKTVWSYDCVVRYLCPNGDVISQSLANLKNFGLPLNPFNKAMGLLGAAGWELVSIQHGMSTIQNDSNGRMKWDNCIAYFKRPSIPGRAVDDPKLPV